VSDTPPRPSRRLERPALERRERAERREATQRSIQRNASQARGELERGNHAEVIRITGVMLRGRDIRSMTEPQVPLVYYRGRAYEAQGDEEAAKACYRVLAAWDGGAHPLVDDAREYIDLGLERLLAISGEPPTEGHQPGVTPPERDRRVFPPPYLTVLRLIVAVAATMFLTVAVLIVIAIVT